MVCILHIRTLLLPLNKFLELVYTVLMKLMIVGEIQGNESNLDNHFVLINLVTSRPETILSYLTHLTVLDEETEYLDGNPFLH
jgi:hypothetical protein